MSAFTGKACTEAMISQRHAAVNPLGQASIILQQLIQGDRQVADALASRVEHRIRHCSRDACNADFSNPVRAHRRLRIGNIEKMDLNGRHV